MPTNENQVPFKGKNKVRALSYDLEDPRSKALYLKNKKETEDQKDMQRDATQQKKKTTLDKDDQRDTTLDKDDQRDSKDDEDNDETLADKLAAIDIACSKNTETPTASSSNTVRGVSPRRPNQYYQTKMCKTTHDKQ